MAAMDHTADMRHRLNDLFETQALAVVATHNRQQPYASLVAFYASEDLKYLFFATPRATRKFANLTEDPRVAVLVNSSQNSPEDFHRAIAVTATGSAAEIADPERTRVLVRYLKKHPHLEEFVRSPTCALVRVQVKSYYMVRNFQNVMELRITR